MKRSLKKLRLSRGEKSVAVDNREDDPILLIVFSGRDFYFDSISLAHNDWNCSSARTSDIPSAVRL